MKRWIAVFVVLCCAFPLSAEPAAAQAACAGEDVLILMDESQSLRRTDSRNARVTGAKAYVAALAQRSWPVRVAIVGFGDTFNPSEDAIAFVQVEPGTRQVIDDAIDGFATRVDEPNTDYVVALHGTLDVPWLSDCRTVQWFTDGDHDLRDSAAFGLTDPRPYDAAARRLVDSSTGEEVERLLVVAACGTGDAGAVTPGYRDLFDRMVALGIGLEITTLEVADFSSPPTVELFSLLEAGSCGRSGVAVDRQTVDDAAGLPFLFACQGLQGSVPLTVGTGGVVWDGTLPEGVAPALVTSARVVAGGDGARLTTEHPNARGEDDLGVSTLDLEFVPGAAIGAPVMGEGVERACGAIFYGSAPMRARALTSPVFVDDPFDVEVVGPGGPIDAADLRLMQVVVEGIAVVPELVSPGILRITASDTPGRLDATFSLSSIGFDAPATATASIDVQARPSGPILRLGDGIPSTLEGSTFLIPIQIERADGAIRLQQPEGELVGLSDSTGWRYSFPDGSTEWDSDTPIPTHLRIELDRQIQTGDDFPGLGISYRSDVPPGSGGEAADIEMTLPVGLDRARNPLLEAVIVGALLLLLLLSLWAWLYGINRVAGRLPRLAKLRYAPFAASTGDDGWIVGDLGAHDLRRPRRTATELTAGPLRARRKVPLRVWRPPYVEVTCSRRPFVGVSGGGAGTHTLEGVAIPIAAARLAGPLVVVVDPDTDRPTGVVIDTIAGTEPAEQQLTQVARALLALVHARP